MKKAHRKNQYWILRDTETQNTATLNGMPILFTSRGEALACKAKHNWLKGFVPTKVRIALGWSDSNVDA